MNPSKPNSLTFQELILRLQAFWAERGCVLQQPYDVEVGAGTMAPETFLRVLGPKPYKVAYVQPSRRPADGRYGENPNRLFKHTQLQVILKPPPENVQELYLESLGAIGIDLRQHDIKFEEDNWEAPTLSAWGVGWQVMLDGLEITQFTYFQQCGGLDLFPISAELTYGLERICGVSAGCGFDLRHRVGARSAMTGKTLDAKLSMAMCGWPMSCSFLCTTSKRRMSRRPGNTSRCMRRSARVAGALRSAGKKQS